MCSFIWTYTKHAYPHVTLEDGDEQHWEAKPDEALSPQSKLFSVGRKVRVDRSQRCVTKGNGENVVAHQVGLS